MPQNAIRKFLFLLRGGRLRSVGTQILIMSAVLLAASILLLWVNYIHLRDSLENDRRTSAAVLLIDQIESKLVGVEMTVRGYALTGEPSFKKWGGSERRGVEMYMKSLGTAMDLETDQKQRFAELQSLVRQRLDLYDYLFQPEHTKEVARAILDPKTRNVMALARKRLAGLRQKQMDLLTVRQAATTEEVRSTLYLTAGIVILAFVSVMLGIVMAQSGDVKPEL